MTIPRNDERFTLALVFLTRQAETTNDAEYTQARNNLQVSTSILKFKPT